MLPISPLVHALLFFLLAFSGTTEIESFFSEGALAGVSEFMVMRLVSVMEELVW